MTINGLNEHQDGNDHTHINSDKDRTTVTAFEYGDEEWESFKEKFDKSYEDEDEEAERRASWEIKIKEFNEHNEKFARYETYFNLEVDFFTDMPPRDPEPV